MLSLYSHGNYNWHREQDNNIIGARKTLFLHAGTGYILSFWILTVVDHIVTIIYMLYVRSVHSPSYRDPYEIQKQHTN